MQIEDSPDGDCAVPSPTKSGGRVSHRPVPLSHAKLLETRIKEELTRLGILECNEVSVSILLADEAILGNMKVVLMFRSKRSRPKKTWRMKCWLN